MTTTPTAPTCPKCGSKELPTAESDGWSMGTPKRYGCGGPGSKDCQIAKLEAELTEVKQEVADWTLRAKSWESIRELTRTEREKERGRAESAEAESQLLRARLAAVKKRLDLSHCFQEPVAEIKLS